MAHLLTLIAGSITLESSLSVKIFFGSLLLSFDGALRGKRRQNKSKPEIDN